MNDVYFWIGIAVAVALIGWGVWWWIEKMFPVEDIEE